MPSQIFPTSPAPEHSRCANEQLQALLRVSRAIGSILDLPALMEEILRQVTSVAGAERSSLFLHDAPKKQLVSKIAQGAVGSIRIPDDKGLVGRVFLHQRPLVVVDTYREMDFAHCLARQAGYIPRSMIILPLSRGHSQRLGILQVMHQQVGHFGADQLPLLDAIAAQVAISIENARLYDAQRRQFNSFVLAFSAALDARDPATQIHSINVANYAAAIALLMGLPPSDVEWVRLAGLLHDVGKIGTPEQILLKPGPLDPSELDEMKKHATLTRNILAKIEFVPEFAGMDFIAAAHHEKLDGTGYPYGLRGQQIPLKARILAVADIYHALTQDRAYRKGMPPERAWQIIDSMTPHQLDPSCVLALKQFLGFASLIQQNLPTPLAA